MKSENILNNQQVNFQTQKYYFKFIVLHTKVNTL